MREDPERAAALAALCGYLPLALQIVAALLGEEPGRPVAELVAELAEEGARLEALAYEEVTLRATFDLAYRDLPEDQARLFRLLSAPRARMYPPRSPPWWPISPPRGFGGGWRDWPARI